MTDAITSIVTSPLGTPGCAAFTFTRAQRATRSCAAPYDQFSETRTGGAFTFTTGAGGFLQEFLYGYAGLRWRADRVHLDPSLPPQLTGVTLGAVRWRGRTLRIAIRRDGTDVTLRSGAPVAVESPAGLQALATGATLRLATRPPDTAPTGDAARCRPARSAPATAEPAEAAVDGSVVTSWLAERPRRAADRRPRDAHRRPRRHRAAPRCSPLAAAKTGEECQDRPGRAPAPRSPFRPTAAPGRHSVPAMRSTPAAGPCATSA